MLFKKFKVDFSEYKEKTILRRVDRRVKALLLSSLDVYVQKLKQDDQEVERLYQDLLIGVTSFFRDRNSFEYIEFEVIPSLFEANKESREIRLWLPGSSSGEEAYSFAMMIKEYSQKIKQAYDVKIFASDINRDMLAIANRGMYLESQIADIGVERLERFFTKKDDRFLISSEIRNMVVFTYQNIVNDPPFTRVDLIVCRNLLIYLRQKTQQKVLASFHFGLKKDGILFLGPSEGLGGLEDEFKCLNSTHKVYKKSSNTRFPISSLKLATARPMSSALQSGTSIHSVKKPASGGSVMYDLLLQSCFQDCLVINTDEEVVHMLGKAKDFLSLQDGGLTNNINNLIIKDLKSILTSAIFRAENDRSDVVFENIVIDGQKSISITVRPIIDLSLNEIKFYIISFDESDLLKKSSKKYDLSDQSKQLIHDLELQLNITKQNLSTAIEDAETTNEELQSTNEELLASNEELQSTNEELHSVNEELYTVNTEYQKKIEELSLLEDDIENILQSSNVGTLFVDNNLIIRRITPAVSKKFGILFHDVGRTIEAFVYKFNHEHLLDEIKIVIKKGVERSLEPRMYEDCWYIMKIMPFIKKNQVEGAVINFVDISPLKEMEVRLIDKEKQLKFSHKELDDFAYFSAHDLKGLLRGINFHFDELSLELPEVKNSKNSHMVQQDIKTLDRICDALIRFSNLGKEPLQIESTNINAVVTNIAKFFEEDGAVDIIYETKFPIIQSDPNCVKIILDALIYNAVKYNHSKKKIVEIGSLDGENGMVVLYVRDNGIGIDKSEFESIFKMFKQLNRQDQFQRGVGVGLSFAKRALEKLDGRIWLESEPNIGSTFYISIPTCNKNFK